MVQVQHDSGVSTTSAAAEQPVLREQHELPSEVQVPTSPVAADAEPKVELQTAASPPAATRPSTANSTTSALPPSSQMLLPLPALLAQLSRQPQTAEALAAAAAALASSRQLTASLPPLSTDSTSVPALSLPGLFTLPSPPNPSSAAASPSSGSLPAQLPPQLPSFGTTLPLNLQHSSAPTRKMTPNLLPSQLAAGVKAEGSSLALPRFSPPMCMALAHEAALASGEYGSRDLAPSFLPGTTRTGKRRRRHPVAEVKGNWTYAEDRLLIQLVKEHGPGCWSKLLPHFPGRIGKQLRERWNHELRPDINKQGWQAEEELALVAAHRTAGNCWADIAKVLPGRTQNGVKNHWHATMRKVQRAPQGAAPQSPLQAYLHELRSSRDGHGSSLMSMGSGQDANHSRGALSPGEASDRGSEEDESDSDREQDSEDDGPAKMDMLASAGLQHQESGVTPKTPAEKLETPRGFPPHSQALHAASSGSASLDEDTAGENGAAEGSESADGDSRGNREGSHRSFRGNSRKRLAAEVDDESAPRAKKAAGRLIGSSSRGTRRGPEASLKPPEHSVVDSLLLLQGAAEESEGTPPPQGRVRMARRRRPPAWQRDMTPGTSTPRGNDATPGGSRKSPAGPAPGPAGLMSVISAAAMAADGMQAMGMRHAGEWEASQLEAALASGGFSELVGRLGGTDWPAALGSKWRGPKGSHKRPGYVLLNLLRTFAELPQLWGLQEALREASASSWSNQAASDGPQRGRR